MPIRVAIEVPDTALVTAEVLAAAAVFSWLGIRIDSLAVHALAHWAFHVAWKHVWLPLCSSWT